MAGGKFCPKCGYSNPAERGACLMCYARLDQAGGGRQCPQCNAEVSEKSHFCAHCGAALEEGLESLPGPVPLANLLLQAASGGYPSGSGVPSQASSGGSAFVEPGLSDSQYAEPAYAEPVGAPESRATAEPAISDSATLAGSAPFSDSGIVSDYDDSHFELAAEPAYQFDSANLGETGYDTEMPVRDSGSQDVEAGQTRYDTSPPLGDSAFEVAAPAEKTKEAAEPAPPPPPPIDEGEIAPPPPPPVEEEEFAPPPPPPPAEAAPGTSETPASAAEEKKPASDFGWELDLPEPEDNKD